jgi:hypothetical protein
MPNAGDSCTTCFFGVLGPNGIECRVEAPIPDGSATAHRIVVQPDFWCGAFSPQGTSTVPQVIGVPSTTLPVVGPEGPQGPPGADGAPGPAGTVGAQGPPGTPAPTVPALTLAGNSVPPSAAYTTTIQALSSALLAAGLTTHTQNLTGVLPTDTILITFGNLPAGCSLSSVTPGTDQFTYVLYNGTGASVAMPAQLNGVVTVLRVPSGGM